MKKRVKKIICGIVLVIAAAAIGMLTGASKWSQKSFEAVVQETVTRPEGEPCLIVERTTEIYSDPVNSLHISKDTKLIGPDGGDIALGDIQFGCRVEVTLKDAFTEETPFYYPVVYEIKVKES